MDPLLTPNSNKTVYLDALYEYNLISFIKYLLSLKNTTKINNVNIVCYAGFRDPPTLVCLSAISRLEEILTIVNGPLGDPIFNILVSSYLSL